MPKKFLSVGTLALLQIAIVGSLQLLPANAIYGFSLPFLYLLAAIGFFIPCVLMTAELATTRPQTGGAYIWCEQAFGSQFGFFTMGILWISNLLWYPSIFFLIATNAIYIFNPALAGNTPLMLTISLLLFWMITCLNYAGIKISSFVSASFTIVGIIMPMLLIIVGGVIWFMTGNSLGVTTNETPFLPDLTQLNHLNYFIIVAISLAGIEITAVHAGDVKNPKRDYPRSLLISSIILLILLLSAELSIALIIPYQKLNLVSGLLDALQLFFQSNGWQHWLKPILTLVFLGNLGSAAAWMLGVTRGMFVACQRNHVSSFLQKQNRYESPVGVLTFEAIIFTLANSVFILFPHATDSFWLLMDMTSQISLIYYIILFVSAIRLRHLPPLAEGFIIPGGKLVLWILMSLGIMTASIALLLGFIAPDNLSPEQVTLFHITISIGLLFSISLPLLLLFFKDKRAR